MAPRKVKEARHAMTISEIFSRAQENPSYQLEKHVKLMKICLDEYEDEKEFALDFKNPLYVTLASFHGGVHAKKMVQFIVDCMVMKIVEENELGQETFGPFLQQTFKHIWDVIGLDDKNFRFNSCSLLKQLLTSLAEKDILIDDDICDKITQIMIGERICDKLPSIREEAVQILKWLQDDSNPECKVTRTLMFHLDRDVSSDVRRKVLGVIFVSSVTLPSIVRRIRDVKECIRIDAFKILAERRKMTSLTYATREKVILAGLKDESEAVRNTVKTYLLPHWLEQLGGGVLQFVRELDAEIHPVVPKMVLPHLFITKSIKELLVPLEDPDGGQFVPIDCLDPSLALYWSCLAKYLAKESKEGENMEEAAEALEKLVPTVTELCIYIGMAFDAPLPDIGNLENRAALESRRVAIIICLLDIFNSCDLSDESWRVHLRELLERMLRSNETDCHMLEMITRQFSLCYVNPCDRVNVLLGIIDEIRRPLKPVQEVPKQKVMPEHVRRQHQIQMAKVRALLCNLQVQQDKAVENQDFLKAEEIKDEIKSKREELKEMDQALNQEPMEEEVEMVREALWDTHILVKCLTILRELMRDKEVFTASIGLADIMESFVPRCVTIDNPQVMAMSIEIVGIFCLQRLQNAKNSFRMFYVLLNNDLRPYDEVRAICVKCICSVLVHHGLTALGIPENEPVFAPEKRMNTTIVKEDLSYISNISYLMDDQAVSVRNQATIGLCKLLLSGYVTSVPLLSRMLLLWFNPNTTSNKQLMRALGQFFYVYPVHHCDAPRQLAAALLPTIDLLVDAPHASPLLDIDAKEVGLFILDLTKPGTNKYFQENPHDLMCKMMLEKILEEPLSDAVPIFLRLCLNLALSLDDDEIRDPLLALVKRIKKEQLIGKNRDIDKLLARLRDNDDPSSQSSQDSHLMSLPDSSESKENTQRIDLLEMEIEDVTTPEEDLSLVTPKRGNKRQKNSTRGRDPFSDSDSN